MRSDIAAAIHRWRVLGWAALALWASVVMAVGRSLGATSLGQAFVTSALSATGLAVAFLAGLAATVAEPAQRQGWILTAAAGLVLALSAVLWFAAGDRLAHSPAWLAVSLDAAASILLGYSLMRVAPPHVIGREAAWHWVFDLLIGAAALYTLAWGLGAILFPIPAADLVVRSVAAMYAASGVALAVTGCALAVVMRRSSPSRRWLVLGVALYGAGLLLWAWWYRLAPGEPLAAHTIQTIWVLAWGALGAAAIYRLGEPPTVVDVSDASPPGRWRFIGVMAMPVEVAAVVTAVSWLALTEPWPTDQRRIVMAIALALTGAVVARGALSVVDGEDLLARMHVDPLTGLFNRRYFHERLAAEVAGADEGGKALSVALLDLDDFASVNATCGRGASDAVLERIGRLLLANAGRGGVPCRVGGDEFGLIMTDTSAQAAIDRVRDILDVVGTASPASCPVTASAGVATLIAGEGGAGLVERADRAQYWVKYRGKDSVAAWDRRLMGAVLDGERAGLAGSRTLLSLVRSLAAVNDAREPSRTDHSRHVASLAIRLGRELGMAEEDVRLLEATAVLHDIGMVCAPDRILDKTGTLTAEERCVLENHPTVGAQIVAGTALSGLAAAIEAHHERWDGTGYPRGLEGEQIPLAARILAVCDAFDGVTGARPYHAARDRRAGIAAISEGIATRFDPRIGEAAVTLLVAEEFDSW